jgi:preprotein translocase subunit SecD
MKITTLIVCILLAGVTVSGCHKSAPSNTAPKLTFYIVSDTPIKDGRLCETTDLGRVGYISEKPQLTITRLVNVFAYKQPYDRSIYDRSGNEISTNSGEEEVVSITFNDTDAREFTEFTKRASQKRILLMLDDVPVMAPVVKAPVETKTISITVGKNAGNGHLEKQLKQLVQ